MIVCSTCHRPYEGDSAVCPFDGTPLPLEARTAGLEGRLLAGRYHLDAILGRGGMGAVFRATDQRDGSLVAVKVLPPSIDAKPDAVERFLREARAVAGLADPRVIRIFSYGEEPDGTRYIVMELLRGHELSARLSAAPMSLGEALLITREVARGLASAHASGVIHRDLKPSNVFLLADDEPPADGAPAAAGPKIPRIKILDFGVAKILGEGIEVTQVGVMVGTPAYMSPEQARGGLVDTRVDVYGLGALLYRLLSGRLPFTGESAAVVLAKVLTDSVPPLRRLRPGLPRAIEELVQRAMARRAEDRFDTIAALADAIDSCLATATPAELAACEVESVVHEEQETMDERPSSKAIVRLAEQRLLTLVWAEGADEASFQPLYDALVRAGSLTEHVIGDRGFGLFGAEISEGDEPLRAVRAAMEGHGSSMKIGIATGRGRAGSGEALSGSVVDAAHRLAGGAAPGEVVCDDETFRRIRGRFDVDRLAQGRYRIREERPHGYVIGVSTTLGIETGLVGRDVEVSQLRSVFHRAEEEATTQAAVVVGGPGIGKSRLAHEMSLYLESLPYDVNFLEGRGDAAKRTAPFYVIADAIRRRGGLLWGEPADASRAKLLDLVGQAVGPAAGGTDRVVMETAHLVGAAVGVDFPDSRVLSLVRPDPRLFRERLIDAIVAYLRGLGRDPTAIFLEDLQRCDEGTLSVIDRLMEAGEGAQIFLLLVTQPSLFDERPDFLAGVDAVRVELRPLARRASLELLRALLPGTVSEEVSNVVLARAGGVPFFIEELCAELRERRALQQVDGTWRLAADAGSALPQSVEAVLQARLDHLPAEEKDLLMRASVLGESFWDRAVEHLGAARVGALLPRLRARELVSPRPTSTYRGSREYAFRNALVREVAYGLVAEEARAGLHRAAAAWLTGQGERDPAVLARHHDLAGDAARAATLFLEAAREASGRQSYAEAIQHATRALQLTTTDGERLEAHLLRHEAFAFRDERAEESEELEALEELSTTAPSPIRAEIALRRGLQQRFAGNAALARDAIEDAAARFRELDREIDVARALLALAELTNAGGAHEETERAALAALEIASRVGRRDLEARATTFLGLVKTSISDFEGGRDYLERGLAIAREIGDRFAESRILINLGWVLNQLGAWAEAVEQLEAARAPAQLTGKRLAIGYLEHNLGYSKLMMGRVDEAITAEERSIRIGSETQDARLVCVGLRYLAIAQLRLGRVDLAEKTVLDSIARAQSIGHDELEAEALTIGAAVKHARGDLGAARAATERALSIRNRLGGMDEHEVELLVQHAKLLDAMGQPEEAGRMRASARALVVKRADLVRDEQLRRSYLSVPVHAALFSDTAAVKD